MIALEFYEGLVRPLVDLPHQLVGAGCTEHIFLSDTYT